MARENKRQTPSNPGPAGERSGIDSREASNDLDLACPHCGSELSRDGRTACRDCGTSFSVRVREEFALVERGGWTVAVSLGPADRQGAADG